MKVVGSTCHKCGRGKIQCEFDDGGFIEGTLVGQDACFRFTHICSFCRDYEEAVHMIWIDNDQRDDYICDFCGKDWFDDPEYLKRSR